MLVLLKQQSPQPLHAATPRGLQPHDKSGLDKSGSGEAKARRRVKSTTITKTIVRRGSGADLIKDGEVSGGAAARELRV